MTVFLKTHLFFQYDFIKISNTPLFGDYLTSNVLTTYYTIFLSLITKQEPHLDLLSSLLHESGGTHVRRICVPMVVYILLMTLLVVAPIWICRYIATQLNSMYIFELNSWYILPELQLPLELAIGHISFLTVLDKKKNIIGRLQHIWMVFACEKLGLTRFLLPMSMIKNNVRCNLLLWLMIIYLTNYWYIINKNTLSIAIYLINII